METMSLFETVKEVEVKFNYEIMSLDRIIAVVKDNELKIKDYSICPFYLGRTNDFKSWVESRAIDEHRPSSRILKKMLRIKDKSNFKTALNNNCVTLTDTYWVRPIGSNLKWDDVKIGSDIYSNAIISMWGLDSKLDLNSLIQDDYSFKLHSLENFKVSEIDLNEKKNTLKLYKIPEKNYWDSPKLTYETTNIGSYEKCWKKINGIWYMLKKGDSKRIFSELVAYRLCLLFNYSTAEYHKLEDVDSFILSKNFNKDWKFCLEPMSAFVDEEEDYKINITMLKKLEDITGCELVEDYLKILAMDILVFNVDRHTVNYGILRESTTGCVVSMAPNFDNNLCLLSNLNPRVNITPNIFFNTFMEIFKDFNIDFILPNVAIDKIESMIVTTGEECDISEKDIEYTVTLILNNYKKLKQLLKQI